MLKSLSRDLSDLVEDVHVATLSVEVCRTIQTAIAFITGLITSVIDDGADHEEHGQRQSLRAASVAKENDGASRLGTRRVYSFCRM